MSSAARHIVSRFKWDTSFDWKESAGDLQSRLSSWSKTILLKEMCEVFDMLCADDQIWRINSLELDLGEIDYENLEGELSVKLKEHLREKLTDLIISMRVGESKIKILSKNGSQMELIRMFLMQGVMTWNYKSGGGSINDLFAMQLQNNMQQVIRMLRQVGATHENVRKRIALQINESNLTRIIQGLEPNNYSLIADFSNELIRIRAKENIVQASTPDFKKSLWFWILNHLLSERGTIFNKVAFMKSSIKQMSQHYNLGYIDLLKLIEMAVDKGTWMSSVGHDFFEVIKILSLESKPEIKGKNIKDETIYWDSLEQFFVDPFNMNTETEKFDFNELILSLSNQNHDKFGQLVFRCCNNDNRWVTAIKKLNGNSLELIIAVIVPENAAIIIESISLIEIIARQLKLNLENKFLWKNGIDFLLKNKNTLINLNVFIDHLITTLCKEKKLDRTTILKDMIILDFSGFSKSIPALMVLDEIAVLQKSDVPGKNTDEIGKHILKLTDDVVKPKDFLIEKVISYDLFDLKFVLEIIDEKSDRSAELAKMMLDDFSNPDFKMLRRNQTKDEAIILNYLIPEGYSLMNNFIDEILPGIVKESAVTKSELICLLHEVYWKCILNYKEHLGKKEILKKMFLKTVSFQFNYSLSFDKVEVGELYEEKRFIKKQTKEKLISDQDIFLRLVKYLNGDSNLVATPFSKDDLKSGLIHLLENNPSQVRKLLKEVRVTESGIKALSSVISFEQFCLWIAHDKSSFLRQAILAVRSLLFIVRKTGTGIFAAKMEQVYWAHVWEWVKVGNSSDKKLREVISFTLERLSVVEGITSDYLSREFKKNKENMDPGLCNILSEIIPGLSNRPVDIDRNEISDLILKLEQSDLLEEFLQKLIIYGKLPFWFENREDRSIKYWMREMVFLNPVQFLKLLKNERLTDSLIMNLYKNIGFDKIAGIVGNTDRSKMSLLAVLCQFNTALGGVSFQGISGSYVQFILYSKLIKAWRTNNWRLISVDAVLTEIIWELSLKKGVPTRQFIRDLDKARFCLPVSIQISLEYILDMQKETATLKNSLKESNHKIQNLKKARLLPEKKVGITVRNAGLVLVSGYIDLLFKRLGFVSDGLFVDREIQSEAVHYLQYVVTGLIKTEESLLPLNKLLCGLTLSEPVKNEVQISEEHKNMINGLIKAIIGHWPAIGDCSVNGFRGNWLVRDGILFEHEDKWELVLETKAYDILIHKSPFSFSIINFHWMDKPLYVNWPY